MLKSTTWEFWSSRIAGRSLLTGPSVVCLRNDSVSRFDVRISVNVVSILKIIFAKFVNPWHYREFVLQGERCFAAKMLLSSAGLFVPSSAHAVSLSVVLQPGVCGRAK